MADPCEKLRDVFSNILKDISFMSSNVIKRSELHLRDVESLNDSSVEIQSSNIRKLLERVTINVNSFKNTFDTAIENYKNIRENSKTVDSSQQKPNDNLKNTIVNGDVDLTVDDDPGENSTTEKRQINGTENNIEDKDGDESDSLSEKTVQYFDVPISQSAAEDFSDFDDTEVMKTLDLLDKIEASGSKPKEDFVKCNTESSSFDFDDTDDELIAAVDKAEKDNPEQVQKDNHELLDLLNKAIGEGVQSEDDEDKLETALKELEDDIDISTSSDIDSDDESMKSENEDLSVGKDLLLELQRIDSEDEGNISDVDSLSEEEPKYELKNLQIDLKQRIDQLDDVQIDNLCNLNNINKTKCMKLLKQVRRKKFKRIRLLSTSSSSVSSSDFSSDGSTTPDLVIDTQERPPSPHGIVLPDVTALADELADMLDKNMSDKESEDSSVTVSDIDLEGSDKEKEKGEEEVNCKRKNVDVEDDEKKEKKKRRRFRDDIHLWTSSSEDEDDEVEENINSNDPFKEEIEDDGDSKENLTMKKICEDTMVITDTESISDSDDDVAFVDETSIDDKSSFRGRRNIRSIISDDELNELTQRAKNEEDERISRLEEHTKNLESIQSQSEDFVLDVDIQTGAPTITVNYKLTRMLKPHQKDGIRFMWEACYGSIDILRRGPGTGCILAHCMGLGKTLQVITLVHTLFTHEVTRTKHVLVTCPLSTVNNWKNEFQKTFKNLDLDQSIFRRYFIVHGDVIGKIQIIQEWRKNGGVLVMGYETFQILTSDKLAGRVTPQEKDQANEALIDPGPDLIVCDEGHQLKNGKTLRTKALMRIKTKRRIVLTGTPLQNNLKEYYFMVQFVKPHLLGTYTEYTNRFATPIQNGQYHDSRPEDVKLMKKRTHVLIKLLKKTVHRVEASVLSSYLPEIIDYTIFVKMTPLQMELYSKYISIVTSQGAELGKGFLTDVMMLNFNNLHPYTIQLYYSALKPRKKKRVRSEQNVEVISDDEEATAVPHVANDWFKALLPQDVSTNINYSAKLKLIFDIIDEAGRGNEKVLIFGKYLVELNILENFLKVCGTKNQRIWRRNQDYFRMDGETPVENRDQLCKNFNKDPSAKVFLLTHRVGGLGLNLTGANRVIMIGSNHNPSLDTQSMYRVYRFGQTKKCYVYRLLSLATMEEKIYHRCVVKLHLSGTVVDKLHFARKYTSTDLQEMYKIDFAEYLKDRPIPIVPNDKLLGLMLQNTLEIYRYHPHNSLLENRPEEELTDEDKTLAWDEFNNMELAATSARPPVIINPLLRLPAPVIPVIYHTRNNAPNLVPNPMNNNTRGFLPRGLLLSNNIRPAAPQMINRFPNVSYVQQQNPNWVQLFNQNTPGQNRLVPINQNTPGQNRLVPINQNTPGQNRLVPINQNIPGQNHLLPINQNIPGQNRLVPINQNTPGQNRLVQINQNIPGQNRLVPINQNIPGQNHLLPINQNIPGQNRLVPINQNAPGQNRSVIVSNTTAPNNRQVVENGIRLKSQFSASEALQNLRKNIGQIIKLGPEARAVRESGPTFRNQSREGPVHEATPSGEFNYALNKVV